MDSTNILLLKASDAEDSYALAAEGDGQGVWRAQRGYGSVFENVWTVELQSEGRPELRQVDWDAVLERAVEAYDLNDPVIANFEWPLRSVAQS